MEVQVTGRRIAVQGTVQGVGFRPWIYKLARELELTGTVKNGPEGVTIDVFGGPWALERLLERMKSELPPAARIEQLAWEPVQGVAPKAFEIIQSDHAGHARASIPADLAMCDACREEIHDPEARRFHYPFTNCTHCGPRFSIVRSIPYDRPGTTLAGFPLCKACLAEYEDPLDRRFHAQPIACPVCGPRLSWLDADGRVVEVKDPLEEAAVMLERGGIVALRGLGGFHLACDARNDEAVKLLRRRKHRDEKPLAVMVPDAATARALADFSDAQWALLTAPSRPIVLVSARPNALPDSIAPRFPLPAKRGEGQGEGPVQLGLFLPYTPLHELLLARLGRPLVMTSGNLSDEPMAVENEEAVERLRGIADGFLAHDRPIATRTDDSVARIVGGAPMLLRRARGFVPQSLRSPVAFPEPVLAVGAQLKNTFCIGARSQLTLGPHVGDLDDLATFRSFEAMLTRLEQFLEVKPEVIAHDLHPDYQSTRYAKERGARQLIAVQHHHAHVAAVMAEHDLKGPVLGVAFDGTGLGTDGTAWGGEFLLAGYGGFERLGTLRAMPLAGGERAIKDAWRVALAVLDDAFDGAPPLERIPLFQRLNPVDIRGVRQLLRSGLQVMPAHGAGRAFDAAAALVLGRGRASFEAQLAMGLEQAAVGAVDPYPFELIRTPHRTPESPVLPERSRGGLRHSVTGESSTPLGQSGVAWELGQNGDPGHPVTGVSPSPWELDLRPMWRALVKDLINELPAPTLAARFHATLGAGTAAMICALLAREGKRPVVLCGGSFINARLVDEVLSRLDGFDVFLPRQAPPGDGGLALGQAVIAAAHLAGLPEGVR